MRGKDAVLLEVADDLDVLVEGDGALNLGDFLVEELRLQELCVSVVLVVRRCQLRVGGVGGMSWKVGHMCASLGLLEGDGALALGAELVGVALDPRAQAPGVEHVVAGEFLAVLNLVEADEAHLISLVDFFVGDVFDSDGYCIVWKGWIADLLIL